MNTIKKVTFVGAGIMGCWNSLVIASAGYDAVVYDVSEETLQSAPKRQQQQMKTAARIKLVDAKKAEEALARIRYTRDPEEAADQADLLSESVPERIDLKRQVHTQFDLICPEKTIFTSNSSSLLVSEIEDAVTRRDKFAALHFHLFGRLVDIVGGPKADPALADTLTDFVRSFGQTPVVHTVEKDGYLFNTLLIAGHKTAVLLVADGYGTFENVDRSIMAGGLNPIGPFAQLDMVGLDLALEIFRKKYDRDKDPDFKRAADFIDTYVQKGHLGRKTGQGFYTYPKPAWQQPDFL